MSTRLPFVLIRLSIAAVLASFAYTGNATRAHELTGTLRKVKETGNVERGDRETLMRLVRRCRDPRHGVISMFPMINEKEYFDEIPGRQRYEG
jgi:hypothetical protein